MASINFIILDAYEGDQSDRFLFELLEALQSNRTCAAKMSNLLEETFALQKERNSDFVSTNDASQLSDPPTPRFGSTEPKTHGWTDTYPVPASVLERTKIFNLEISVLSGTEMWESRQDLTNLEPPADGRPEELMKEPLDSECLTPTYSFNPSILKLRDRKSSK